MKKLTAKEIHKKFSNKYIDIYEIPIWMENKGGKRLYEIRRVYDEIHENTCLGQDVGTSLAYTR